MAGTNYTDESEAEKIANLEDEVYELKTKLAKVQKILERALRREKGE